jgi:hypothetical protein
VAAIEGDPDAHIAVSGTQATNAYDGADWSRLDRVIDDFLSYDGGNQWDMHRSFAKPNAMIGFWTGYGSARFGCTKRYLDCRYPQRSSPKYLLDVLVPES